MAHNAEIRIFLRDITVLPPKNISCGLLGLTNAIVIIAYCGRECNTLYEISSPGITPPPRA
jgi:hypothetical protein